MTNTTRDEAAPTPVAEEKTRPEPHRPMRELVYGWSDAWGVDDADAREEAAWQRGGFE